MTDDTEEGMGSLSSIIGTLGADALGLDLVRGPGGVALFPRTMLGEAEWERLSVDLRDAQDRDRITVADIDAEESSESTFGRFTLRRV